jgi:hypothetical protein
MSMSVATAAVAPSAPSSVAAPAALPAGAGISRFRNCSRPSSNCRWQAMIRCRRLHPCGPIAHRCSPACPAAGSRRPARRTAPSAPPEGRAIGAIWRSSDQTALGMWSCSGAAAPAPGLQAPDATPPFRHRALKVGCGPGPFPGAGSRRLRSLKGQSVSSPLPGPEWPRVRPRLRRPEARTWSRVRGESNHWRPRCDRISTNPGRNRPLPSRRWSCAVPTGAAGDVGAPPFTKRRAWLIGRKGPVLRQTDASAPADRSMDATKRNRSRRPVGLNKQGQIDAPFGRGQQASSRREEAHPHRGGPGPPITNLGAPGGTPGVRLRQRHRFRATPARTRPRARLTVDRLRVFAWRRSPEGSRRGILGSGRAVSPTASRRRHDDVGDS